MSADQPILTLEPLLDAVQIGVEESGWCLSGLQKTTSHQFEGRWEGEATRSAYLFFHRGADDDEVSIDVFLDETTRGLTGNLALVVDLLPLAALGDVEASLVRLTGLARAALPKAFKAPVSLRFAVDDSRSSTFEAQAQVRFKVRIPAKTIQGGAGDIRELTAQCVEGFQRILASPALADMVEGGR